MRNTDLLARLRLDATPFEKSLRQAQSELQSFSRVSAALPGQNLFGSLASDAAALAPALSSVPVGIAAVGVALTGLGVAAQRSGQAFEFALARIRTLGDDAQTNLGAVRAGILDTFSNTPLAESLNDVVEANYELQSSGRSAAESILDTKVAAQAAVAGFTTTRVAVDAITTATNAWKGSIDTAEQASDILFVGVNRGKVRFDELAASIGNVAPTAAGMNVSLEETVGAIAALSLQGVRTSTAVEGLRSALINIQAPTEAFKRDYSGLAKEFDASRLARDGLLKFLVDFDAKSGGSRDALKALFSDTTAFNTALGLLKDGGSVFASILDDMGKSAGVTRKNFEEVNATAEAQERLIKNRLTRAWTEFGESINTAVLPALSGVADVLKFLNENQLTPESGFGKELMKQVTMLSSFLDKVLFVSQINDALGARVEANVPGSVVLPTSRGFAGGKLGATSLEGMTLFSALANAGKDVDLTYGGAIPTPQKRVMTPEERKAIEDAAARRKKIEAEAKALLTELEGVTTRALEGVAGALRAEIERQISEVQALLDSPDVSGSTKAVLKKQLTEYVAVRSQLLDAQQGVKTTAAVIEQAGRVELDQALQAIALREQDLQLQLAATTSLEARAVLEKDLLDLAKQRAGLTQNVSNLPDADADAAALRQQIAGYGDLAQQIATVGDQLGVLPRRAADALRGIGALAEQGAKLSGSFSKLSTLGKVGAGVGIVAGIASLAAGLFSESPEDKQRKADLRANTEALRLLTSRVGDLATSALSGSTISRISRVLTGRSAQALFGGISGAILDGQKFAESLAAEAGVSFQEFTEYAKDLGITLNGSTDALRQFVEAARINDFKQYSATFAGSMNRLNDTLRIDGVTDAVEVFRRKVAVLVDPTTGFPALATALEGIDLSTVEGRSTAAERGRSLFDRLAAGQIAPAEIGGLSFTEARQTLVDFISAARETNSGAAAGTAGFNETRTITEVTGSRLASLLGSANTYLSTIAADVAALRATFVAPTPMRLSAPSVDSLVAAGAQPVTIGPVNLTINVTLTRDLLGDAAPSSFAMGDIAGRAISERLLKEIDEGLNNRRLRAKLMRGDVRLETR